MISGLKGTKNYDESTELFFIMKRRHAIINAKEESCQNNYFDQINKKPTYKHL